jgi:hypothetical protein
MVLTWNDHGKIRNRNAKSLVLVNTGLHRALFMAELLCESRPRMRVAVLKILYFYCSSKSLEVVCC